ncbi:substrate-binding domain-containing protein [Streptomyces sp. NBC_01361]|uniref:substrate-binding domain-containing protein n=1 Tax=Streptomyces sp. NBC_01361 TaxID=2903838 RepID=UPI002E30151C|nr:substrate-binding domain-containing protein [Streptomyces sp. NBC_01361]
MQALTDAGLRVPDDMAVVGSDNLPLGSALRPQLTTTYLGPLPLPRPSPRPSPPCCEAMD